MAFKRSAVRSRLSPPQNTDFYHKSRCFSNFLGLFVLVGQLEGQQKGHFQVFCCRKAVKMAYIQEKTKGKKIVSFKFKACLGRDVNGKQIFKCWTWYPPADLTPAKARKEAQRVAGGWEEEVKQIIVVIAPQKSIGTCGVKFALFVVCLLLFGGEVEVFECDFPVVSQVRICV